MKLLSLVALHATSVSIFLCPNYPNGLIFTCTKLMNKLVTQKKARLLVNEKRRCRDG